MLQGVPVEKQKCPIYRKIKWYTYAGVIKNSN